MVQVRVLLRQLMSRFNLDAMDKTLLTKTLKAMKNFINDITKDYVNENFSSTEWIIGAIIAPLILFAIMGFAGWLETLCK